MVLVGWFGFLDPDLLHDAHHVHVRFALRIAAIKSSITIIGIIIIGITIITIITIILVGIIIIRNNNKKNENENENNSSSSTKTCSSYTG